MMTASRYSLNYRLRYCRVLLGLVLAVVLQSATRARAETSLTPASGHQVSFSRTLYLVRHGAYDVSVEGDEEKINGLTPLGIAQARLMGTRLRSMSVTFDSLVSSTYTRARETADVINQSLPKLHYETSKLLCECVPPIAQRFSRSGTVKEMEAAKLQLDAAFAQYFLPATDHNRQEILVCHGNVIRYFVMKALGVDTEAWPGLLVAHCSLTVIQVKPDGKFNVFAVGDTGHLPANMVSGFIGGFNPELSINTRFRE